MTIHPKIVRAAIIGAISTLIFIVAITIMADLVPDIKDMLKNAFTHHWVGKSVLSVIFFILISMIAYFGITNPDDTTLPAMLRLLSCFAILGTMLIYGFFVYEAFFK